jgi:hypothetical protein
VTRTFSEQTGAELWDINQNFLSLCGSDTTTHCGDYFLSDQHPNAKGQAAVAALIEARLARLLLGSEPAP